MKYSHLFQFNAFTELAYLMTSFPIHAVAALSTINFRQTRFTTATSSPFLTRSPIFAFIVVVLIVRSWTFQPRATILAITSFHPPNDVVQRCQTAFKIFFGDQQPVSAKTFPSVNYLHALRIVIEEHSDTQSIIFGVLQIVNGFHKTRKAKTSCTDTWRTQIRTNFRTVAW